MRRLAWRLFDLTTKTSSILLYPLRAKPFKVDQKRYWSQRAEPDAKQTGPADAYYSFYNQTIVEKVRSLEDAGSILEVGCYVGERLSVLNDSFPEKRLVGCDFGAAQLSLCRKRFSSEPIGLVNGDGRFLPFRSNSVDLVFTSACLEHIPYSEIGQVLQELARVSKRYIMLAEAYIRYMSIRQKLRLLSMSYFYMHDYETLARNSGLRAIDSIPLRDDLGHPRYTLLLFTKEPGKKALAQPR